MYLERRMMKQDSQGKRSRRRGQQNNADLKNFISWQHVSHIVPFMISNKNMIVMPVKASTCFVIPSGKSMKELSFIDLAK